MALWRERDYRMWLAGDTSSTLATSIRSFAVPLVAFGITGSATHSGLLGSITTAIALVASLAGGVVVDRIDRRRGMIVYAALGAAIWGVAAGLLAVGWLSFGGLVALVALGALVAGIFGDTSNAALRSIVRTEEFATATATNQGRDAAVQLAASPLSGALYAVRAWSPFGAAAAGYAALAAFALAIQADLRPGRDAADVKSPLADLREGGVWVWRARAIRDAALVAMLINFGLNGIFQSFQLSLLQQGMPPALIGTLGSASAAAMIAGAIAAPRLVARVPSGWIVIGGLAWCGAAIVPAVASQRFAALAISSGLIGLALPVINSALLGYAFAITPTHLQGRVGAVETVLSMSAAAFAPGIAGLALDRASAGAANTLFLVAIVVAVAAAGLSPAIRGIPTPDRWPGAGSREQPTATDPVGSAPTEPPTHEGEARESHVAGERGAA